MTVVCNACKKETNNFEFKSIGNDIVPLCRDCYMLELVSVKQSEFDDVMKDLRQLDLKKWLS